MANNRLTVGSHTIVGDREYQQDLCAYEWMGNALLAVLCDGMGGMEGGEIASRIGVETAQKMFRTEPPAGIYGAAEWMKKVFIRADMEVADLTTAGGDPMNSGTTGILVMVDGDKMQWGSVGDSRIYLKRGADTNIITRMHNYNLTLDEMLKSGQINEAEREELGTKGEALISFLGIGGLPIIDIGDLITLQPGDVIVLCSDGVYKSLDLFQVNAIIEECGGNMQIAAERLVNEAYRLKTKKQDNTTAIAIGFEQ